LKDVSDESILAKEVTFDEFSRIDFRIGKVVEAQLVPGTKKLVKLQIDIGGQVKQSLAGLGDQYKPEDLKSRLVVVVTNLKPRQIFGLTSEVMLLAALDGQTVTLLQPDKTVATGSKVT